MLKMTTFRSALLGCAAVAMLGACSGSDGVASPGVGAFVPAPTTPTPPPPTTPTPPTTPPGTPAADCPAGFSNVGTVSSKRICQLPATITGNLVVPARAGTVYSVNGRTSVGTDLGPNPASPLPGSTSGILTIEPGVTIFGNSGLDYLLVNRGSQIFAEGTQTNPVIMTSRQNVEGTATDTSIGQWGGLVIAGRGPTTDGCSAAVTPPNIACEAQVEGTNGFYGGNSTADNSGRIRYLRLSFSGFELAPGNELNGITLAGVGSGTTIDHVQVHNSSDDGIEIFGGNVNLSHLVLSGADDDAFDLDSGWRGAAQFGIIYQRTGGGDRGFEASSRGTNTADFFTRPTYSNWTIVARSTASTGRALTMNSGHTGRVYNTVIVNADGSSKGCINLDGAVTLANSSYGPAGSTTPTGPLFNSMFLSCPGAGNTYTGTGTLTDGQVQAQVEAGSNIVVGTSSLTGGFINGPNETAVPASTFPTFLNTGVGLSGTTTTSFLTPVTYIGAVQNASDTWYQGWTCGIPGQPAC